jgi:hypothetical protein
MNNITVNELTNFFTKTLQSFTNDQIKHRKEQLMSSKLPITINKSLVKQSKIHGNGLFAKVNIKKGDIITFYPCDILQYYPDKNRSKDGHKVGLICSDDLATKYKSNMNHYKCYAYDINDSYSIIGFPEINDNPSYLGHICNDGARSHNEKDKEIYMKVTLIKSNATFHVICDCIVAVVAVKDINIDEEILVPYTPGYWMSYVKKFEKN